MINLLVIGKRMSWLVSAKTDNKRFFVGTKLAVGLSSRGGSETAWGKLRDFVARYAAPGSVVMIYYLHGASKHQTYLA